MKSIACATPIPTGKPDELHRFFEEAAARFDEADDARRARETLSRDPMRIVGWATFTLGSDSLDEAHEYAGHAKLHVDIALSALDC